MGKLINIGVLGCSNFATRSLIPSIKELPDLYILSGIASRNPDKAKQCAEQFSTRPIVSYDKLLDEPSLDAVYIPLPNALHFEWIDRALNRGLHVLVEKSLACSASEVRLLNQIAESRQLVLVENFQFRFHRQLGEIRKLMKEKVLGEIRCIRSSFGFPPFTDPENIRYKSELGGGALLDAGAYTIKISQEMMGHDLSVTAAKWHIDPTRNIDMWGGGFISKNNGDLFSEIAFGFDHYYQCSLEIWGSKGKLFTNRLFTAPPGYKAVLQLELADGISKVIHIEADNHFINMLTHFYYLVQNVGEAKNEYSQNIRQAELIEQFRNLANGK